MTTAAVFVAATVRNDIADFLNALLTVYIILILAYIVVNMFFAFGGRPPYSRALDAVLTFLRDVSEPFLSIFRRFIPPIGPIDISPIVAILVLRIVGGIIIGLIDEP
jgi:YggT family protein